MTMPRDDIQMVDRWESTDTTQSEGSLAAVAKQEEDAPGWTSK